MTSISSSSAAAYPSPLDRLKQQLSTDISAGTVQSSDNDALSSALDSIDSSLSADRTSGASQGTRPSPSDLKDKINSLIADQVDAGSLTSDQADELKKVFADTFKGGPGGAGGHHRGGPGGAGAPASDGSDAASATTSATASDPSTLVADFLKTLQQSTAAQSGYGETGAANSTPLSLLLDTSA